MMKLSLKVSSKVSLKVSKLSIATTSYTEPDQSQRDVQKKLNPHGLLLAAEFYVIFLLLLVLVTLISNSQVTKQLATMG